MQSKKEIVKSKALEFREPCQGIYAKETIMNMQKKLEK